MSVTKDVVIPDAWAKKFDLVIQECSGALSTGVNSIKDSLIVMNGIRSLKGFFNTPEVRELVEMSQESPAGFLTDRTAAAVFKHNKNPNKNYELKSYTYTQIVEALIPCALEGYRLHGNEINIISGKGMPVKAGKFRRILEMTDGFQESISTPAVQSDHAFIKCRAKWKIDGREQSIGYEEGDEVHVKLKFGKWDSLDKVRGLAQSKLYSQVLTRITGRFIVDEPENADIPSETEDVKKQKPVSFNGMTGDEAKTAAPEKKTAPKKTEKKSDAPRDTKLPEACAELDAYMRNKSYAEVVDAVLGDQEIDSEIVADAVVNGNEKACEKILKAIKAELDDKPSMP